MSEPASAIVEINRLLAGRYTVERVLGEGAHATTYVAKTADGRAVALKELAVGRVESWKAVELFEREGRALRALNHPAIPAYEEAFHVEDGWGGERFFLAQALVEGRDLGSEVERGRRWTEAEARALVAELLEVLAYLQSLSPAMVHRDIKPSNIMERADGSLALIDFGAVQMLAAEDTGGSTIVGTTGYMPVEQLMGRAVPATDLYALGATAVHVLSGRHPTELPVRRMALDFRDAINVSDSFARFLQGMLSPDVEDRYRHATEARAALEALGGSVTLPGARRSFVNLLHARRAAMARPAEARWMARVRELERDETSEPEYTRSSEERSALGAMLTTGFAMVFVITLAFGSNCGRISAKISGYEEVAFGPLKSCPLAQEALGEGIGVPMVGCQTGSTQTSVESGSAVWKMTVGGSKARGTYKFSVLKENSLWVLRNAQLDVGDRSIDIANCTDYVYR